MRASVDHRRTPKSRVAVLKKATTGVSDMADAEQRSEG
jgi:hypothetical protein